MPDAPPKSYKNLEFLNSAHARTIRILAEYLEPQRRLRRRRIRDTIVFFGSARFNDSKTAAKLLAGAKNPAERQEAERLRMGSRYYEDARRLAAMLTKWSRQLPAQGRRFVICSGGGSGIMEAANRGAHEAGGPSIGLNISLPQEQVPNPYITPEFCFQFHYFFMRKLWFAYLAKALIVFPGGFGTFDEMMEILTLVQTEKLHKKVLVLIYGTSYWNKVLSFDAMEQFGTIDGHDRDLFRFADTPHEAFALLTEWLRANYL